MQTAKDRGVRRSAEERQRHLVHVFASFGYGGVPIRICDVINGLPEGFRHTVVALDGCFDAKKRLMPNALVETRELNLPRYNLLRSIGLLRDLVREVQPDLLLTYNWGAIEPALANRFLGACEHIHFESGFGVEEGSGQLWRRNLFRRIALARVQKVVVPSVTLMKIASNAWSIPEGRLLRIPNGVELSRYHGKPGQREGVEMFGLDPATIVIGTVAPLRPEKNVGRLLRAFAGLTEGTACSLLIAGTGEQSAMLEALTRELGIAGRARFLGHVEDVPAALRAMDIFALSSDTEQMPNSLLQAMAAGRPVAAVDVGDVARIVATENRSLVVPRDEEGALTGALETLVSNPERRQTLGAANQARARDQYSLDGMIAAYAALLGAP